MEDTMKKIILFLIPFLLILLTTYYTSATNKPANTQQIDWGIYRVKAPTAWKQGYTGKGIKIAVLDTGIGPHQDIIVSGGVSFVGGDYHDRNGHGTSVAGIIGAKNNAFGTIGVAPNAQLYAVKVLPDRGSGTITALIKGINWAIANKMDIINMSLTTPVNYPPLQDACERAYRAGILLVGIAGNFGADGGKDTTRYPAKYPSVIAVGNITSSNTRYYTSSYGPSLEVVAPGKSIYSPYKNHSYTYMTGTSMAAPYVTGILALLKQKYPTLTNIQLRALLDKNTHDLGTKGRDSYYGYGLVQFK